MTVAQKVEQCIANLRSAHAALEGFALDTQNQAAKQTFKQAAQQCRSLVDTIEPRLHEIQNEEPQYQGT